MFTIYGRIPSKKNRLKTAYRGGKSFVFPDETYKKWEDEQMEQLEKRGVKRMNIKQPLKITYKFWFPDKRKTDLSNKIESINDLLVRYGLLEDDNHEIIKCIEAHSMGVDKELPRVEVDFFELYSDFILLSN